MRPVLGFGIPMIADPRVPGGEVWMVVGERVSVRLANVQTAGTTASKLSDEAETFGQSSASPGSPGYAN